MFLFREKEVVMVSGVGQAPGKALLIGEHAVVYGHPAIAIPLRGIQAQAEAVYTRAGGIELAAPDMREHDAAGAETSSILAPLRKLAEAVLAMFSESGQGVRIELHSTIPIGRGMGSGAAVSVALVRALCDAMGRKLSARQICDLAMVAEKAYHGTPSGVDPAVVAHDQAIYFVKGKEPRPVRTGPSAFHFLVADSGMSVSTADVVRDIRAARERDPATYDSYFWELGSLASVAREVLKSGSPAELGLCMTRAHKALQSVGVSCAQLDRLVAAALEHGALGAKLTGAGRGGAILALLNDPDDAASLTRELISAGAEAVYTTSLSSNGKED
jgi:mevalonate kinase